MRIEVGDRLEFPDGSNRCKVTGIEADLHLLVVRFEEDHSDDVVRPAGFRKVEQ